MLRTRIVTAVISLAVIGLVVFILPPLAAEVVIAVLIACGAWEWSAFLGERMTIRVTYTALVSACLVVIFMLGSGQLEFLLLLACAWWLVAFLWIPRFPTSIPPVVRWLCGFLVLVPLFAALLELYRMGRLYLIAALLIVWAADAGAYFAGKQFGRVKLAPMISPGKTWEGVIGGFVLVAVLAVAIGIWQGIGIAVLLPFCLAVAGISVVGDLTVSMFKRTAGVKDSGSLFPGHGGVLDRIDSVASAAPLFVLGLCRLGLAG